MAEPVSIRFGDLGQIFDGPHATPKRLASGAYFLNIASLQVGRLDLSSSDHVSAEDFANWTRRVTPSPGDLLFSYETRLGEVALMPEGVKACLGRRMALLRPDKSIVDSRFLLYYYLSPAFQQTIAEHTIHGATVPRIGLATMGNWKVAVPELAEQRAIAEVLGALDDRIAANDRLARTAARLADTRFVAAVRGVPMGDKTFGDLADVRGGGTPKTSVEEYWNGEIPWATPTDVTALDGPYLAATSRTISEDGLAACASKLYPEGSILMTSRATIGAFALGSMPVAVNQGFIVVNAYEKAHQFWLFHEMRHRIKEFISHANGATFLELSRGTFKQFHVRAPKDVQANEFAATVRPLHARAAQAYKESRALARTRDELLPLLMSGKVRVKAAEKIVEEAV